MMENKINTSAAALKALLKGVTAGPWSAVASGQADDLNEVVKEIPFQSVADCEGANARFIAAARDLVPALAAENSALTEERDALRAEVERLRAALTKLACKQNWDGYEWAGAGFTGLHIANEAIKGGDE